MKIFVIGNGFDLHHDLDSTFRSFYEYIKKNNSSLLKKINVEFSLDRFWNDLENRILLNVDEILDDAVNEHYPNLSSDKCSTFDDAWLYVKNRLSFIDVFKGDNLYKWLCNVNIKEISIKKSINDFMIDSSDIYLTFNYTTLLEKYYNILPDKIMHIHGCIDDVVNSNNDDIINCLQLGYYGENTPNRHYETIKNRYENDDMFGVSISLALDRIYEYDVKCFKNVDNNCKKLNKWFDKMVNSEVTRIVIMGHSLNRIDQKYYDEILIPRFSNACWVFLEYSEDKESIKNINDFIKRYNIHKYLIKNWEEYKY